MKQITQILRVEKRISKKGKEYYITTAQLDFPPDDPRHEEPFEGYGKEFKVGDKVESWFDDLWNKAKMQK